MWRKRSSGRSFGFIPPSGGSRGNPSGARAGDRPHGGPHDRRAAGLMLKLFWRSPMWSRAIAAAPAFSPRHHLTLRISSIVEEVSMKKSRLIVSLASVTLCVAVGGLPWCFRIRTFPLRGQDRAVASLRWFRVPGVAAPPRVVYKVDPHYTPDARRREDCGDSNGRVGSASGRQGAQRSDRCVLSIPASTRVL